ncbi:MAG: ABC transporter permease subunit [Coriobacteriales bacterium]|nr:ABC transporter permease subunit [Coriobacteriales bacterium]
MRAREARFDVRSSDALPDMRSGTRPSIRPKSTRLKSVLPPGLRLSRKTRRKLVPYLLFFPAAILLFFFVFGMINGVLQGFGIAPFLGKYDLTLDYYIQALTKSELSISILFSLYLAVLATLGAAILGIVLSAAICKLGAGRKIRLFGVQMPMMVAHSVVVLCLLTIFSSSGLLARFLFELGLITEPSDMPSVLGAPSGWGIILTYIWREVPFIAFCTITIMAHIGDRYGEAAAVLGANSIKTFFTVTLPLCKSAIIKASLVVFAYVFGSYEVAALLGPTLPKALPVLAYYQFKLVDITNRCLAMALNGITIAICMVVVIIYFITLWHERREGQWTQARTGETNKE